MFVLLILLQAKHLVADWLYQPAYMYKNKGILGHPGGILHAGFHAALTFAILLFFVSPGLALAIAYIEGVAHYLIDWSKVSLGKRLGLQPIPPASYRWPRSDAFWMFLGIDQFLHQLCYVAIVWYAF